ncbi:MAG: fatty-acid oxidation protein subunit alpha [Thermoanaerobaculia bacterium]|nr:fatty-acid oxidation protein subunit alpha [Thermoanaerobaculia bacterium]
MAKDKYHKLVREALEKDGWHITNDPFYIRPEKGINYPVDLTAERVLIAQKGPEKIAVEIKRFLKESSLHEFHQALGQYLDYQTGLEMLNSSYELVLAIPEPVFNYLWSFEVIRRSAQKVEMKILVYKLSKPEIAKWIR